MPIYEYRCAKCHTKFELLRPMSQADAPTQCPGCHSSAEKLLSTFANLRGAAEVFSPAASSSGGCSGCSASSCASCGV